MSAASPSTRPVNHYDDADKAMHDAQDVLIVVLSVLNNTDLPVEGSFREALGIVVRLGEDRAKDALTSLDAINRERHRG